jgi:hypothetical protein
MVRIVPSAFVLAMAVWLMFYFYFPDAPLKGPESTVVVVLSMLVVAGARALFRRRSEKLIKKK